MSNTYEFSYQSPRQKLILWSLKIVVAYVIGSNLYSLGWPDSGVSLEEKLSDIGSILGAFWIYSNLCRVRVEVQELFVEPMDINHMQESLWIALFFILIHQGLIILDIFKLQNWL